MNGFYEILETFAHPHYPKSVTTVVGIDGVEIARIEEIGSISFKINMVRGGIAYEETLRNALLHVQASSEIDRDMQPSPHLKGMWGKIFLNVSDVLYPIYSIF